MFQIIYACILVPIIRIAIEDIPRISFYAMENTYLEIIDDSFSKLLSIFILISNVWKWQFLYYFAITAILVSEYLVISCYCMWYCWGWSPRLQVF